MSGVEDRVGSGHGKLALEEPREQGIGRERCGPGDVVGTEEPDGVEGGAGGFERAHDLDRRVAGFGGKEGFGGDAFERGERIGEGDRRAVEVERGERVKSGVPLAASLEFGAVEVRQRRPAGGFEKFVNGCGPVGVRALAGEFAAGDEWAEGAQVIEEGGQVGAVLWVGGKVEKAVEGELGFEEVLAAEDEGVELGAGDAFGRVCGEVGREQEI